MAEWKEISSHDLGLGWTAKQFDNGAMHISDGMESIMLSKSSVDKLRSIFAEADKPKLETIPHQEFNDGVYTDDPRLADCKSLYQEGTIEWMEWKARNANEGEASLTIDYKVLSVICHAAKWPVAECFEYIWGNKVIYREYAKQLIETNYKKPVDKL